MTDRITQADSKPIAEGDSKTVNGITVEVHRVTEDQVYYAQFREEEWGEGWPFYRTDRAEFERLWEAEI